MVQKKLALFFFDPAEKNNLLPDRKGLDHPRHIEPPAVNRAGQWMPLGVPDCHFDMTAISRAFSAAVGDESVQADGLGGFIEGEAAKVSSIFVAAGVVFEQIAHDQQAGLT
jgi:hypothetical protein